MKLTTQIDESIYPYKMIFEIEGVFSQNKLTAESEGKNKQDAIEKLIGEIKFIIKKTSESIEKIKNI